MSVVWLEERWWFNLSTFIMNGLWSSYASSRLMEYITRLNETECLLVWHLVEYDDNIAWFRNTAFNGEDHKGETNRNGSFAVYISSFVRVSIDSHLVSARVTDVSLVFCWHGVYFHPFLKRLPPMRASYRYQIALTGGMVCRTRDSQHMSLNKRVFVPPGTLTNILTTQISPAWLWYWFNHDAVVLVFFLVSFVSVYTVSMSTARAFFS